MQKQVILDNNNYVQSVSDTAQEGSMEVEVNGYQAQLLGFITNKIFYDKDANALKFPPDYPATDEKKIEMKYKGSLDDMSAQLGTLKTNVKNLQEDNSSLSKSNQQLTMQNKMQGNAINALVEKVNSLGGNGQQTADDANKQNVGGSTHE
ncbi:DNA recombination protein RmuC [Apilactobacillus timberlakei]|uniref:DNA recombination protein RmuC n=1 Tax=Apilactobacillus timberlakei TaxID=2008380 RepID=UPI00112BE826|nr:DNA recombination protein RmuC [Apilactobacillus timberlakei]TPR12241.1 hypothetical protein DYZ97_07105 [Apilactobacillus timberlakei]